MSETTSNANVKSVISEAMRLNAELAKLVVERFVQAVDAMVAMVRAEGAPLPLRRIVARVTAMQSRPTTSTPAAQTIDRELAGLPANVKDLLPPIDRNTAEHFLAIQKAMSPDEASLARDVASNLSANELRQWFDELDKLTVPQAVHKIRVLIAGNTEAVSAS